MRRLNRLIREFENIRTEWETHEEGYNDELDNQLHVLLDDIRAELDVQMASRNINIEQRIDIEERVEW